MSPEKNARARLLDLPPERATLSQAGLAASGLAQNSVAVPAQHNRLSVAEDGGAGEQQKVKIHFLVSSKSTEIPAARIWPGACQSSTGTEVAVDRSTQHARALTC